MNNGGIELAIGVVLGALSIGYAIGQRKKLSDISNKVDKSIEELSTSIEVDFSDAIVRQAVDRAVERETVLAAKKATNRIVDDIEETISRQVKDAVDNTYSDIRKAVEDETIKKVSQIDIQSLKNEVVRQTKKQVAQKFDTSLNDILEDFNRNLNNVSQIYQSIAQTFPNGREWSFI